MPKSSRGIMLYLGSHVGVMLNSFLCKLVSIVENDHGWFRQLKITMASFDGCTYSWLVSIVEDDCG